MTLQKKKKKKKEFGQELRTSVHMSKIFTFVISLVRINDITKIKPAMICNIADSIFDPAL